MGHTFHGAAATPAPTSTTPMAKLLSVAVPAQAKVDSYALMMHHGPSESPTSLLSPAGSPLAANGLQPAPFGVAAEDGGDDVDVNELLALCGV